MSEPDQAKPLSVSAITAIIRDRIEHATGGAVTVEGEVSNYSSPAGSHHLYFAIKDESALLNVTFFATAQARQGQVPAFKNGDKVLVTGGLTLFPPQGRYQLNAARVELAGQGDLLAKFDILKRKLYAEGVCDPSRKKPLPRLPKRIGVVTALNGAALRDILQIISRRYANLQVVIAPARVQGQGAAEEIAASIARLNAWSKLSPDNAIDAMIVGRGGGSLEDLWCFNEELVARAVIASEIPIISAVGHEPDIAITDFVADLRAPTPSAAAELICGRKEDYVKDLAQYDLRLLKAMRQGYRVARDNLRRLQGSALFRDPLHALNVATQKLDTLAMRLDQAVSLALAKKENRLNQTAATFEACKNSVLPAVQAHLQKQDTQLTYLVQLTLQKHHQRIVQAHARLMDLSPFTVLSRGYSMTTLDDGSIVRSADSLQQGQQIHTRLATGTVLSTVETTQPTASPVGN